MSTTRTLTGSGASGLGAHQPRQYASVGCPNVQSPARNSNDRRPTPDNSNMFKKLEPWGIKTSLLVCSAAVVLLSATVGVAFKRQAAEHQHQLSFLQGGVQQMSIPPSRQVVPHVHHGASQRDAAASAGLEGTLPAEKQDSTEAIASQSKQHTVLGWDKVSLLAQREQQRSTATTEVTDTPTVASSTQTGLPANTGGGVSTSVPLQTVSAGGVQFVPLPTTIPANVTTLLTVSPSMPLPVPALTNSSVTASPAAGAPTESQVSVAGTPVVQTPAVQSAGASTVTVGAVQGTPTVIPIPVTGLSVPTAPVTQTTVGSVAGASGQPVAPVATGSPTLVLPTAVTSATALPAAMTTSKNEGQTSSAAPGGTTSTPTATALVLSTPLTSVSGQSAAGSPSPTAVTDTSGPLAAAQPTILTTAAPVLSSTPTVEEKVQPQESPTGVLGAQAANRPEEGFCTYVGVTVAAILVFVLCVSALIAEIIMMGNLFSKGCMSKSFMRGGGWAILLAAALGLGPGLLTGGLVSSCWTMALFAGGGFMDLAVSIVLLGTRGAWIGALGGAVSAATVAALISPTALPVSLGGIAGLLGGIVIGFVPLLTSLEFNVRYIRFRMRSNRGDGPGRHRSTSRGNLAYGPQQGKRDSLLPRDSRRSTAGTIQSLDGERRTTLQPAAVSPVESSDEATVIADDAASTARL